MVVLVLLLIPSYGLLVLVPRGVVWFMRCETGLFCLGNLVFGIRNGLVFLHLQSVLRTLQHWPYTTGLLVKWVSFSGSLHWPAGGLDLGVGGVSYLELLII